MRNRILTFVAILGLGATLLIHAAYADDDICAIRPDLCDDTPAAPAKAVKKTAVSSTSNAQSSPTCRPAGAYSITQADLPECKTPAKKKPAVAKKSDDDLIDDFLDATSPPPVRRPASNPNATGITFDEYMASNASDPALSGFIPDHQRAFVDPPISSVLTIPTDGTIHDDVPANSATNASGTPENSAAAVGAAIANAAAAAAAANPPPASGDGQTH